MYNIPELPQHPRPIGHRLAMRSAGTFPSACYVVVPIAINFVEDRVEPSPDVCELDRRNSLHILQQLLCCSGHLRKEELSHASARQPMLLLKLPDLLFESAIRHHGGLQVILKRRDPF